MPVFVMPGARLVDIERARGRPRRTHEPRRGGPCARAVPAPPARRHRAAASRASPPVTAYVDAGFGGSIQRTTLLARLLVLAGGAPRRPVRRLRDGQRRRSSTSSIPTYTWQHSTSGVTLARLRAQAGPAHPARGRGRPGLRRRRRRGARRYDRVRAPALPRALAAPLRRRAVTRFDAVTLDAMGTLVSIEPPAPRLQRSLERRLGLRRRPRALRGRDARRDAPLPGALLLGARRRLPGCAAPRMRVAPGRRARARRLAAQSCCPR